MSQMSSLCSILLRTPSIFRWKIQLQSGLLTDGKAGRKLFHLV